MLRLWECAQNSILISVTALIASNVSSDVSRNLMTFANLFPSTENITLRNARISDISFALDQLSLLLGIKSIDLREESDNKYDCG